MLIRKTGLVFLVMIVLLASSCANNSSDKTETDSQTLTVGIMPDLDSIPFVVAQEQGFLPDYVKLEIFKSPVDRDSAFLSDSLDGTISDLLAVALMQNGGTEAYATSKTNGRYAVLAGKDTGITSASQLEGKQIGLSMNTIIEYVTDRIILQSGGGEALKVAVPQIPARLELLESGQLDAIAVPEPYVTAAAKSGAVILNTSTDAGVNPAVMLFKAEAVEGKSGELKALYEAYDKAVQYINTTEKNEFMPVVIEILGLPETAAGVELPLYETTTLPDQAEVSLAVGWLREKELIDKELTFDDLVKAVK